MNASASSRAGWFRVTLKTLFVFILAVAAFFAGGGMAERRTEKAVREAQEAADVARGEEEQARLELERERAKYGLPSPPVSDGDLPERKSNGRLDWPPP